MICRRVFVALLMGVALTGCGEDKGNLRQFVAQAKAKPSHEITPIPHISSYHPYDFKLGDRRPPFTQPSGHEQKKAANGPMPDLDRKRGPLEHFPLDSLHMVGTLSSGGIDYALIRAPDQVVYRVARGNYIGQHFGRIRSVSSDGITLIEIVPNGSGGYKKRATAVAPSG